MKLTKVFIFSLFFILTMASIYPLCSHAKTVSDSKEVIKRPSSKSLFGVVQNGSSVISSEGQESIASALSLLDISTNKLTKVFIKQSSQIFSEKLDVDTDDFIISKTPLLPRHMPMSERAIIYSLDLQILTYHLMLKEVDLATANSLAQERKKVRMLRDKDRIFGDIRDHFIAEVIRKLKNINKIQCKLHNKCSTIDFSFPSSLKNLSEVEIHFANKIKQVTEVSNEILLNLSNNQTAQEK